MRQEDDGRRGAGAAGDGDKLRIRGRRAGILFHRIGSVDHGEVGRGSIVGDRDPDGGKPGIVRETDMEIGVPGRAGELHGSRTDGDAGTIRRGELDAGKERGGNQRDDRNQDLETQHDTHPLDKGPHTRALWLAECKENSLPAS